MSFGTMNGEPMQIASGDLIFKQAVVKGFWGSKVSEAMPTDTKIRLIGELLRLVATGELDLPVEAVLAQLSARDPRLVLVRVPGSSSKAQNVNAAMAVVTGEFTGVYPRESPGGWQLLGHTPLKMWDLDRDPPALLLPGVRVRFVEAS